MGVAQPKEFRALADPILPVYAKPTNHDTPGRSLYELCEDFKIMEAKKNSMLPMPKVLNPTKLESGKR
ncbi:hypothetical protein GCM10027190_41760 [Spirosoma areae]